MILGALGASLLSLLNLLPGKGVLRAGEETIPAGEDVLMLPQHLTSFETQCYHETQRYY